MPERKKEASLTQREKRVIVLYNAGKGTAEIIKIIGGNITSGSINGLINRLRNNKDLKHLITRPLDPKKAVRGGKIYTERSPVFVTKKGYFPTQVKHRPTKVNEDRKPRFVPRGNETIDEIRRHPRYNK